MMIFRVGTTTFNIITLSKMILSIMGLFATLSSNNIQCYETQHWVLICWVSLCWMMLCWVSLCWMSLCWMSLCWMSLCWMSLYWVSLCWVSWRLRVSSQVLYQFCYRCGPSLRTNFVLIDETSSWRNDEAPNCGATPISFLRRQDEINLNKILPLWAEIHKNSYEKLTDIVGMFHSLISLIGTRIWWLIL
jgi:hypothetical protein